jgi:hypothetical protein
MPVFYRRLRLNTAVDAAAGADVPESRSSGPGHRGLWFAAHGFLCGTFPGWNFLGAHRSLTAPQDLGPGM